MLLRDTINPDPFRPRTTCGHATTITCNLHNKPQNRDMQGLTSMKFSYVLTDFIKTLHILVFRDFEL
jgi:hypothetical protein